MKSSKSTPFLFLFLLLSSLFACKSSQVASNAPVEPPKKEKSGEDEYYSPNFFRYEDYVYNDNIRTVLLYNSSDELSAPVIYLNSGEKLTLRFDDMQRDFQNYSYKIINCDANWTPSDLMEPQYIDGFTNGFILDYQFSFNTIQPYIHYTMTFPNEEFRFTKSGNYLLYVYENNDEDKPVLSRRFFVVEERVETEISIKPATLARYRDYKHEVDFNLYHSNYNIQNPFDDLHVVIRQNLRWDNMITDLKPLFVRDNELVYNYEDDNLFFGGNEFRFFDIKDLRYQSINVEGIVYDKGKTHVYLLPDEDRSFKRHLTIPDLNGRRLIKRDESIDSHKDADYVDVHFVLKKDQIFTSGNVYVFGALSDWKFEEAFKMKYEAVNQQYVLSVPLKQGYYNYQYVLLEDGAKSGDVAVIEGSHFETENDYYFFIYHRMPGENYDRLIGYQRTNSTGTVDGVLKN